MSYTICSRFKGEHIVYAGYTICTSREHIVYGAFCGSTMLSDFMKLSIFKRFSGQMEKMLNYLLPCKFHVKYSLIPRKFQYKYSLILCTFQCKKFSDSM